MSNPFNQLNRIEQNTVTLLSKVGILMADFTKVQTDLDAISKAVPAYVTAAQALIAALQAQIAGGPVVTQAQLDALETTEQAILAAIPPPPPPAA